MHKKIWIDNTMPPTDYIWMRTDLKNLLLGIYAWINGEWRRIDDGTETTIYTKNEVDRLLILFEDEIANKLKHGEYEVHIDVDSKLSYRSINPVQNKVITNALLSKLDKSEFDRLRQNIPSLAGIHFNTTEYWNNKVGYIPKEGEIIIYSDYSTKIVDGEVINVPAIKIGSGNAYVQDLAFLAGDESDRLIEHINDQIRHINPSEREFWNNKLNVTDNQEVIEETLIFHRN